MAKNMRLRNARLLGGMTQLELAHQIGTTELTISRLETGRVKPNPDLKRRIAEVLKKPAHELFES